MLSHFARGFLTFSWIVLGVAIAAWGVTYSPSYRKCTNDHDDDTRYNKRSNLDEAVSGRAGIKVAPVFLVCEGAFIDENTGTLTVIATFAIAGFTLTLWRATTSLWNASERQHAVSNRAFVSLDEMVPDIRSDTLVIRAFWVIPKWRNSGNTPTKAMMCRIHQVIYEGDLPDDFEYRYPNADFPLVIGPNSAEYSPVIEISGAQGVVADQNASFRIPFRQLFIYGRADYQDVFNVPHFTQWCYRAHFYSLDAAIIGVRFTQWGNYNRTDDEGNNA